MLFNRTKTSSLSASETELTAIAAAIASNCVPCVEYHVRQGRKAGLSDSQISEAIELADKVRRVPADKVLQTALALLGEENRVEQENESGACGCPDSDTDKADRAGCQSGDPDVSQDPLDNRGAEEDNKGAENHCDPSMMTSFASWCCPSRGPRE